MTTRPKAYSYLRFSSPEQAKGDSLRRQAEAAERYAAAHNLDLDTELTFEDLGVSAYKGRNSKTGALGLFLRAIEDGEVKPGSYLLVESLDRVSRQKPRKALRVLEEIVEEGVIVVTLADGRIHTEESLDDPVGLMGSLMTFMRAHEESEIKSQRLRAAWGRKRKDAVETGKRLTTVTPAWLRATAEGFEPIPERAVIVRRIFAETVAGHGQHRIAEQLTGEGVPTWRGARVWHRTYVRKILENPAVVGVAVLHETERLDGGGTKRRPVERVPGYYPSVVDEEAWTRVQALIGRRSEGGVARRGRHAGAAVRHLLANLARCPVCDGTMTRVSKGPGGGRAYLVCAKAKAGGGCVYRGVPVEEVDGAIFAGFTGLLGEVPAANEQETSILAAVAQVELERDAITEELRDIEQARRARRATPPILRREAQLYQQLADAESELQRLQAAAAAASSPLVEARVTRLWSVLEGGPQDDLTTANAAMREAFAAVTVDHMTGHLQFEWRHGGTTALLYRSPFADETDAPGAFLGG